MTLHNETDAIKQAVEAGYPNLHYLDTAQEGFGQIAVLQDPAFWQVLGKARGWPIFKCGVCLGEQTVWNAKCKYCHSPSICKSLDWEAQALRYFEILLSGGDIKKYWESLP